MKSDYTVKQLSTGAAAVHRYYDVPCESPDGGRVLYFRFDGPIPGPGEMVVAGRDGADARVVARVEAECIGHVGAQATWIDSETVAFSPGRSPSGVTSLVPLGGGATREVPGSLRQFHPGTRRALLAGGDAEPADEFSRRRSTLVRRYDIDSGEERTLLTVEQAAALHPDGNVDPAKMNIMNTKWTRDGSRMLAVFTDQIHSMFFGGRVTIKSLILVDADGGNARYLGEFTHHPMWTPDGGAVIAHMSRDGGGQDLVALPLDGSGPRTLIAGYVGVHTTLNRAGTQAITDAFRTPAEGQASVLRYELAGGGREVLCSGAHRDFDHTTGCHPHPQWSADESRIYFNMADSGSPQLYCLELNGR